MFDKNLQDLVRGIRNHKEDEVKRPTSKRCHLEHFEAHIHLCISRQHILPLPLSLTS